MKTSLTLALCLAAYVPLQVRADESVKGAEPAGAAIAVPVAAAPSPYPASPDSDFPPFVPAEPPPAFGDPFADNTLFAAPPAGDANGISGDQLRREAEQAAQLPLANPAVSAFPVPVSGDDRYRLQQQMRDLANYLRERERGADDEQDDLPMDDPWLVEPQPDAE